MYLMYIIYVMKITNKINKGKEMKNYNDKMNKLSKQIEKNAEFFQAKCMGEEKYVESLKWMGIKQDQKEKQTK